MLVFYNTETRLCSCMDIYCLTSVNLFYFIMFSKKNRKLFVPQYHDSDIFIVSSCGQDEITEYSLMLLLHEENRKDLQPLTVRVCPLNTESVRILS